MFLSWDYYLEYHAPTYDKSAFNKLSSHYLH